MTELNPAEFDSMLQQYRYGKFGLLEKPPTEIVVNRSQGQVLIRDYYDHASLPTTGECTELENTLFHEVQEKYPDLRVLRATGTDPSYFVYNATHGFLLVASETDMLPDERVDNPLSISTLLDESFVLLDPSFQRSVPFIGSGYKVTDLYGENRPVEYCRDLLLTNGNLPLYFDDLSMVFLMSDPGDTPLALGVVAFPANEKLGRNIKPVKIPLSGNDFDSSPDPIREFADMFRSVRVTEATSDLTDSVRYQLAALPTE